MKVDGIELLRMIKENKLADGTKINVLYDCDYGDNLVCELRYQDNELIWEPGTFRVAMLYNCGYIFEIETKPKQIDVFRETPTNGLQTRLYDKLNETINAVNYLLKKEDD